MLQHAELELGSFRHHGWRPSGIPDQINFDIGDAFDVPSLVFDFSRKGLRSTKAPEAQNFPTLSVVKELTTSGAFEPPARSAWLILSWKPGDVELVK